MSAPHKTHSSRPLLLFNIGQLLTLSSATPEHAPRRGAELRELGIINDAAILCGAGKITSFGRTKDALRDPWIKKNRKRIEEIDCRRGVVLPGFVDAHTHPAFAEPRLVDFERRTAGASYEEIAASGGGIRSSVDAVRAAGKSALADKVLAAVGELASHGTTTVEAKSGYGLSLDSELKSLEAIRIAQSRWPGTIVPTLLGAHAVPREFHDKPGQYISLVCEQMIPSVAQRKLATFVDVFCDLGAFSEHESLRVLAAARENGLGLRAHISQLQHTPVERLLSLGVTSLDHLDHVSEADIALLAKSGAIATLVPGANYFLGLREFPPARKMIDAGVALALATDYNPGSSPVTSMPFVLSLACTHMKMTPAEAICAATINGAGALGVAASKGSIARGKHADLTVFDVSDYREIPYWIGKNTCMMVVARGEIVRRENL